MFDSTGCSGQHAVSSASPRDRLNQEPVHGSAKQGVVVVRSPTQWAVPEGTSSGRALFFFSPRETHSAEHRRRALSPRPVSSCREAPARCGGGLSTSQRDVTTNGLPT